MTPTRSAAPTHAAAVPQSLSAPYRPRLIHSVYIHTPYSSTTPIDQLCFKLQPTRLSALEYVTDSTPLASILQPFTIAFEQFSNGAGEKNALFTYEIRPHSQNARGWVGLKHLFATCRIEDNGRLSAKLYLNLGPFRKSSVHATR